MNTENDLWSREILVEFEDETGCVSLEVVTLAGNGPSDFDVAYEGTNLSFVGWLEGLCEDNALHMLLDIDDEDIDDEDIDDETPLCVKCGPIPDREGGWCPEDPEEGYCAWCCPLHKDLL